MADATDATADMLRKMLSPSPAQRPPDRNDWVNRRKSEATGVSEKTFRTALRSASKGGAADLSGWHYEHLQLTLGRKSTYMSIVDVCSQIAKGCMTDDFYASSALGRVTPLRKGLKNKLRPLVCGSTWRRLTMSALSGAHKGIFRTFLGDEQPAVEVKAALEKLAATLSVLLRRHPDAAVLQIDAVSAFNNMLREVMLEELEACCPQLLTVFAQWLARDSAVVLFTPDWRAV